MVQDVFGLRSMLTSRSRRFARAVSRLRGLSADYYFSYYDESSPSAFPRAWGPGGHGGSAAEASRTALK